LWRPAVFTAAARKLGRAVSVISYAIAILETSLASACSPRRHRTAYTEPMRGAPFFPTAAPWRLHWTIAGQGARPDRRAGSKVSLVVDVMLRQEAVQGIGTSFARSFPPPRYGLHVEALGAVTQRCSRGSGLRRQRPAGDGQRPVDPWPAGSVKLLAVAAP